MLSTPHTTLLVRQAMRSTAPASVFRPLPLLPAVRALHVGQRSQGAALHHPRQTSTVEHEKAPTRAFQPHPKDTTSPSPSTTSLSSWTSSTRPHEDWVLAHPVYTPAELDSVRVVHRPPQNVTDRVAHALIMLARKGFDWVSGYKHASPEAAMEQARKDGKGDLSLADLRKEGYLMTEAQWVARILYLESIAGVPGMTAGILRHLRSLRLMKRDGGWINSLLQEAENERMHLLTFMKVRSPSLWFRLVILGTQGVFFNLFFLSYLFSPHGAHRFVGYLEEQAIVTYTHIVEAIARGEVPEWDPKNPHAKKVPQLAKDYWRMGDEATMLDLIKAVRADEAGHRFVNHTLANLQKDDFNPVAFKHASAEMSGTLAEMTREESLAYARGVQEELTGKEVKAGEKKEM
ncbi:hypothetical protein JCM10207_002564 [Rhodosporidiobolus poonsookiae]